jgi:hypothetical protein
MFYQNDYITKNIKTQQMNEYLRQAEQDRLIARLSARRPNRLLQLARSTLHATGHLLLAAGRRLDRACAPAASPNRPRRDERVVPSVQ